MYDIIPKPVKELPGEQLAVQVVEYDNGDVEFAPLIWVEEYGEYHAYEDQNFIVPAPVPDSADEHPRFIKVAVEKE